MAQLRELRGLVNRTLEDCRAQHELGAGLEAAVRIEPKTEELVMALQWLNDEGDCEIDGLRDWLLISQLQIGGEPWAELISSKENEIAIIEVARARGTKCQRCWHYEVDIGKDLNHSTLCGRCIDVLRRL